MKHYRRNHSGEERIKKIMFRILFVLIAAAVITFATILLGNHLQKKVDALNKANLPEEESNHQTGLLTPEELGNVTYDSPDVFGATLFLKDYTTEEDAVLAVNTLAQYYDTLLLSVTDTEGNLTYTSPALCKLNRMPVPADNKSFGLFGAATAAAKAKNMRLCALWMPNFSSGSVDGAAATDGTLMEELFLYGVDEVLLTLPKDTRLTSETVSILRDYIRSCRVVSGDGCRIGLLLSAQHYLSSETAKQIQELSDSVSFLAVSFPLGEDTATASVYRETGETITSLLGSFNVYNMRVLLEADHNRMAEQYRACQKGGLSSICFVSNILPQNLVVTEIPETEHETTPETESSKGESNPYAVVETEVSGITDPASPEESEKPWY